MHGLPMLCDTEETSVPLLDVNTVQAPRINRVKQHTVDKKLHEHVSLDLTIVLTTNVHQVSAAKSSRSGLLAMSLKNSVTMIEHARKQRSLVPRPLPAFRCCTQR